MPSNFVYSQLFFKPPVPTHSFADQVVIVTGANVGLGFEAARWLTSLNAAKVILAVRNISAGEAAKTSIESSTGRKGVVEVWELDLSSYASVMAFADRAASTLPRLDVLLENAGIATNKFSLAEQDERTVTVNVVSTFLLALLLLPKLKSTAKKHGTHPVLTIVSSEVHGWSPFNERKTADANHKPIFHTLSDPETADMKNRYPTSKLLEVLLVRELAPSPLFANSNVILNTLNPGLCHSALSRDGPFLLEVMKFFLARSTEVGSRTLVAGAAAGVESHGGYMTDCQVDDAAVSPFARSEEGKMVGRRLWSELSAKLEAIRPGVTKV